MSTLRSLRKKMGVFGMYQEDVAKNRKKKKKPDARTTTAIILDEFATAKDNRFFAKSRITRTWNRIKKIFGGQR